MTIAAAYLTSEGVVLGADSTTTILQPGGVTQLLNHAQKVFEIGNPGRLALCTWGAGKVGNTSHRTIAARLSDSVNDGSTSIDDACNTLIGLVPQASQPASTPDMGYFVGGWDPSTHEPKCTQIVLGPGGTFKKIPLVLGEARFAAAYEYFSRVFRGFDPKLPDALFREILKQCPGLPGGFQTAYEKAFTAVANSLTSAGYTDLPIREAIDYIHSYLSITIKAYKFCYGPPTAGGPIEIGFITTDRRFRWASHKPFTSAVFEQEGGPI